MKARKITVDDSRIVDRNFQPAESKQIRIVDIDVENDNGIGVYLYLNEDELLFISEEFIQYFAQRVKSGE